MLLMVAISEPTKARLGIRGGKQCLNTNEKMGKHQLVYEDTTTKSGVLDGKGRTGTKRVRERRTYRDRVHPLPPPAVLEYGD